MALGAGTPDRARIKRKTRGERVDGRYLDEETWTPVFRCRFREERESESRDEARVRRVKPASLTAVARYTTGAPLDIKASDEIEVKLQNGTVLLMQVQGEPRPIRKRRTVIGWTATLQKVTN